jgi:hypothetical protein
MKKKIAPVLTDWLNGGAVYEVDLEKGMKELKAPLAVARAARRAERSPIPIQPALDPVRRALARLERVSGGGR